MKKALFATLLGLLMSLVVAPASSLGAAGYETYVACGTTAKSMPSHTCLIGESPGAFFRSPEEEAEYEVCVNFPEGEELCTEVPQVAAAGTLYVNKITTTVPGIHLVTWYVEGVEVAAWTFAMDTPEPVPTPVVPPVIPPVTAPPVVTPPPVVAPEVGPSPVCLKDKRTTKALERERKLAKSAGRRAALDRSLKRAKAAEKKAC
jgi:hypothetical protein